VRRSIEAAVAVVVALGLAVGAGSAAPGGATGGPPTAAERQALATRPVYSPFASQRIYFVMPDRYANGEPANDRGGRTGLPGVTGYDPTSSGWYHGGDLRGLTGDCDDRRRGLARLVDLGLTALWVTPLAGQRTVQGDSAAYHGYWGRDFTHVDPHLGTDSDFAALTACARRLGLKVYLDVVVNHTADVIALAGGTTFRDAAEVPYRDCRGRAFAPLRFAGGTTFPCLSVEYQPRQPLVAAADRNAKRPAWLNDVVRYHNRGDIDFGSCSDACFEQGDFFGLDDLFTEQPFVVDGLARLYGDWIERFHVDGFRVDTAKHVDRAFFRAWTPKIRAAARAAGVRDFEIFGEVTLPDAADLAVFMRERSLPNVIDFPLQDALVRFAGGSAGARAVSTRLADDDYFRRPDGTAPTPATFLGNHDAGRAALLVSRQTGATGAELTARVNLGHALLFLLRGAPVVYYGDEVGMIGRGGDKAARQDMFPTQVAEWRSEPRVGSPPIGTGSSFDVDLAAHPVAAGLRELGGLRTRFPALSTGGSTVRLARDAVLVVSRFDAAERHEYVALFNASETRQTASFATATPSSSWTQWLGRDPRRPASDAAGRLAVQLQPLEAVLLRSDAAWPARGAASVTLRVGSDPYTNLRVLSAGLSTADPAAVTFAVRPAGARTWRRLAVDDGLPYRAYLDPRNYARGRRVDAVAVVRGSDGSVAASRVTTFVPRR
jgi:glycosidase